MWWYDPNNYDHVMAARGAIGVFGLILAILVIDALRRNK